MQFGLWHDVERREPIWAVRWVGNLAAEEKYHGIS
jgi:hypothetical protein